MGKGSRPGGLLVALVFCAPAAARAQVPASYPEPTEANIAPTEAPGEPSVVTTTTTTVPWGVPAPGTDINAGLPSSSRPVTAGGSADGFDLNRSSSGVVMRGNQDAEGVVVTRSTRVPPVHTVKKGDTLWEICDQYYQSPWKWPEVWSYNPQLQNPHWIYPGDQLRLRQSGGIGAPGAPGGSGAGFVPGGGLASGSVIVPDQGYIGDPKRDVWGVVAGGDDEVQLFSTGMRIYVILRPGVEVSPGQELSLFVRRREPRRVAGARRPEGEIVDVVGALRVEGYDPEKRVAHGEIVEARNLVERGTTVGPGVDRLVAVAPRPAEVDLWSVIIDGFYPNVFFGGQQVLFIDKGADDGLMPGNRLFVIRRGDTWRHSMKVTKRIGRQRMRVEDPDWVRSEPIPIIGEDEDFPDEIVGELRVLRTQKDSSVALVIASKLELEPGDRALARVGY